MKTFTEVLRSERKNEAIPAAFDYFGKLVGGWEIDYIDCSTSFVRKGEWHFSRVLDGMAIQDVIVIPEFETGTTLRIYHPATQGWEVVYCYTGKIMRMEVKKQNNQIVLTNVEDQRRKWVFAKIEELSFHWQDVTVREDGEWQIKYDIFAKRVY